MGVEQTKKLPPALPKEFTTKIALIGCGPSSITCGTFLARMGYSNVHVFERERFGGGLSATEIPQNRIMWEQVKWEVEQMEELGVQIHYGVNIGVDKQIEDLKKEGFEAVYMGNGLPQPTKAIGDIYSAPNVFNSKSFLPPISRDSKPNMTQEGLNESQKLHGHVVVLGIGDTALDCAAAAFRQGAERVSTVFRRGFSDLRAGDDFFLTSFFEGINFVPYSVPKRVITNKDGKVTAVEFNKNLPSSNDPADPKYVKGEEFTLPCDFLVTAFGCKQ